MTLHLPTSRIPDPALAPTINWGIIAPGSIADTFATALQLNTNQRVVACGSRSAERAQAFAAKHGIPRAYGSYQELVADPSVDAVYIASTQNAHWEQALLSIDANKHVLIEKPFTLNAQQAADVVEAGRAKGLAVMEAMWTRFLPRIDIVRQLLEDGALGDIETVMADHGQGFDENPDFRLFDPARGGGALLDLGIYPVSFAHFVLGTPGRIHASGTLTETGVDRQVTMLMDQYPTHRFAQAALTTTLRAVTPTAASISGTEARVELSSDFYRPGTVRLIARSGEAVESAPPDITEHMGLCYQAAHFATMITEGQLESDLLPPDETVAIMRVLDEVRRQAGVSYPEEY
ncbi:MAG: Gfo/Idh/MocA family protein [Arachnia sp.]